MNKEQDDKSAYDIFLEFAEQSGNQEQIEFALYMRDQKKIHSARAKTMLDELISGPREMTEEYDMRKRLDAAIQKNLDADSIWEFIWVCGDHVQELRGAEKKSFLADAGRKGGEIKNSATNALKEWAISKAAEIHDADTAIAEKLSNEIPPHLAEASKNPRRFIYDSLRGENKKKKKAGG